MDSLVDAVRQQQLWRCDPQQLGYLRLHGFALGIPRQLFRIQLPQPFEHSRRAPNRVLVEIQTQAIPTRQRWMIRRQRAPRFPWTKQVRTSPGWTVRAQAVLPPPPDIPQPLKSALTPWRKVAAP